MEFQDVCVGPFVPCKQRSKAKDALMKLQVRRQKQEEEKLRAKMLKKVAENTAQVNSEMDAMSAMLGLDRVNSYDFRSTASSSSASRSSSSISISSYSNQEQGANNGNNSNSMDDISDNSNTSSSSTSSKESIKSTDVMTGDTKVDMDVVMAGTNNNSDSDVDMVRDNGVQNNSVMQDSSPSSSSSSSNNAGRLAQTDPLANKKSTTRPNIPRRFSDLNGWAEQQQNTEYFNNSSSSSSSSSFTNQQSHNGQLTNMGPPALLPNKHTTNNITVIQNNSNTFNNSNTYNNNNNGNIQNDQASSHPNLSTYNNNSGSNSNKYDNNGSPMLPPAIVDDDSSDDDESSIDLSVDLDPPQSLNSSTQPVNPQNNIIVDSSNNTCMTNNEDNTISSKEEEGETTVHHLSNVGGVERVVSKGSGTSGSSKKSWQEEAADMCRENDRLIDELLMDTAPAASAVSYTPSGTGSDLDDSFWDDIDDDFLTPLGGNSSEDEVMKKSKKNTVNSIEPTSLLENEFIAVDHNAVVLTKQEPASIQINVVEIDKKTNNSVSSTAVEMIEEAKQEITIDNKIIVNSNEQTTTNIAPSNMSMTGAQESAELQEEVKNVIHTEVTMEDIAETVNSTKNEYPMIVKRDCSSSSMSWRSTSESENHSENEASRKGGASSRVSGGEYDSNGDSENTDEESRGSITRGFEKLDVSQLQVSQQTKPLSSALEEEMEDLFGKPVEDDSNTKITVSVHKRTNSDLMYPDRKRTSPVSSDNNQPALTRAITHPPQHSSSGESSSSDDDTKTKIPPPNHENRFHIATKRSYKDQELDHTDLKPQNMFSRVFGNGALETSVISSPTLNKSDEQKLAEIGMQPGSIK